VSSSLDLESQKTPENAGFLAIFNDRVGETQTHPSGVAEGRRADDRFCQQLARVEYPTRLGNKRCAFCCAVSKHSRLLARPRVMSTPSRGPARMRTVREAVTTAFAKAFHDLLREF
jgi:hypothetical protein